MVRNTAAPVIYCINMENEIDNHTTPIHTSRLFDVLEKLEQQIEKQNSFKFAFLRGIVYGLGTVIGATALVTLLAWFVQVVTDITITL